MTPASQIIERCGGFKIVADWLGMDRSGVQRWTYDPPKGAGDRVPMRHWSALIAKARANGVEIQPSELMPADVAKAVRAEARQRAGA